MKCQSSSVPSTTTSAMRTRHQCAGRNRRARRRSVVSIRCRASSAFSVNATAPMIASRFNHEGVVLNRASMATSACALLICSRFRSVNNPTTCGRLSPPT